MSNTEPTGLTMTENDIRTHLEILTIAEMALIEEIECLQEGVNERDIGPIACRINGIRRIIESAARDLRVTHDFLVDEMGRKGLKVRFA